jgi:hypothetical protein
MLRRRWRSERRIIDANCQQLEAHIAGVHSKLLAEERTGESPVPAYHPSGSARPDE